MRFSIKLPIIFLVFGMSLLLGELFLSWQGKNAIQSTTSNNVQREASLLVRLIDRNLFERYHDAQAFTLSLGSRERPNFNDTQVSARIVKNLNAFVDNYKVYRRIAVIDLNGNVLAINSTNMLGKPLPNIEATKVDFLKTQWFNGILAGQTLNPHRIESTYVYGPTQGLFESNTDSYDMIFGVRLLDEQGEPWGMWVNIVDFSMVENIVGETYALLSSRGMENTEITLIDEKGKILIDYDPIGQQSAKYKRNFDVVGVLNLVDAGLVSARLAVSGLTGSSISEHTRKKVEQISGFSHSQGAYDFPGLGWSVLIRIPTDEAFAASNQLVRESAYLAGLLLVAIALISFYLSRKIAGPLTSLSKAVNGLASGDLAIAIPEHKSEDEIGSMVGALQNLKAMVIERDKLSKVNDEQQFQIDIQNRAIESSETGIIVASANEKDFPITYVNKAFELLTGYRAEEVVGRNCRFLQGEDTEQPEVQQLRHAIKNKLACSVVLKNFKKDGTLFYNSLHIDPVFSESGQLTHYIGVQVDVTEIKLQERAIRRQLEKEIEVRVQETRDSESRLRGVFDTSLDGTVVIDESGTMLDVNRALELIFGRSREELIGENISILMPASYEEVHDSYIHRYMTTGTKRLIGKPRKVVGLHKSGRNFPIEISVGDIQLGNSTAFVGFVKDITEQENTKAREITLRKELQEKEIVYRAAFSQAAVGMARVSLAGQILESNDMMSELFGYSEADLLTLSYQDLAVHSEDDEDSPFDLLIQESRKFYSVDKQFYRKDGTDFWAFLSISLVRQDNGEPKYFIVIIEDISDRKEFEAELNHAKAVRDDLLMGMRLASDAGGICNWSYNIGSGEIKWDEGMYGLYGVELATSVSDQDWQAMIHDDDRALVRSTLTKAIDQGTSYNCEFRIVNQFTNRVHWVKSAASLVYDEDGMPEMVHGITLDITDERLIQAVLEKESAAARQASEAKSRFLATMSHEIRTPMNGVIGIIDLLRETTLSKDQMRMVSTIRDSSFSLLEVINDILDFSKIESGQMELEMTDCNVLTLIEKTMDALWVNARNKQVELFFKHDFNVPETMVADAVRIRQVLLNLLGNAIKFTHRPGCEGSVKVATLYLPAEKAWQVSITDTGVGMSDEQMDKLFKPFTQADSSTTRKYGGTGLGLSISQSFINLMGGEIKVSSALGKGSTFSFRLPIQANHIVPNAKKVQYNLRNHRFVLDIVNVDIKDICVDLLVQFGADDIVHDVHSIVDADEKLVVLSVGESTFANAHRCKNLILETDPAGQKGYCHPRSYSVATHPLRPSELILGVAILCGLESPEFDWNYILKKEMDEVRLSSHDTASVDQGVVLCAEDQPTNQLVLSGQLSRLGYRYEMTSDGVEALDKWKSGHYSLVLTDCHMPHMDGIELTKEIRRIEVEKGLEKTLIIAVTANAVVGEAERCLAAGMDDYITKPVELATLQKVLALRLKGKQIRSTSSGTKSDNKDVVQDELIDFGHLKNIIGTDDLDMTRAVLAMFWESVSEDMVKLEDALKQQNIDKVRSLAHGAKGSAASSGAIKLSVLLKEIESNHSNLDVAKARFEETQQMMFSIKQKLINEQIIPN
ncbi:PAS domain S-box protein [Pseudoalteromonas xiamenensis]